MTAQQFVRELSLPRRADMAILHTRLGTQGTETDPRNNHPIPVGGLVGVHNGMLDNDYELFDEMDLAALRQGRVDSEAAFAALAYGATKREDGKCRLNGAEDGLLGILERIEGSAALAWMDEQDPVRTLHLARLTSSPIEWVQTTGGSFIFASTEDAIEYALDRNRLNIQAHGTFKEGEYFAVRDGRICEVQTFKPAGYAGWRRYTGTGYRGTYGGKTVIRSVRNEADAMLASQVDSILAEDETLPPGFIPASYLSMAVDVPHKTGDTHYRVYKEREEAIERWMSCMTLGSDPDDWNEQNTAYVETCYDLKAWCREGDWVLTEENEETCYGQIVKMPDTYPHGMYVLRIIVPNGKRDCGYEAKLVARSFSEFESLSISSNNKRPDIEALHTAKKEVKPTA